MKWEDFPLLVGGHRLACVATAVKGTESFRFEVCAVLAESSADEGEAQGAARAAGQVTMSFEAGTDASRKRFWMLYERMQRDVQRTSRKWRRLASGKADKKGETTEGGKQG